MSQDAIKRIAAAEEQSAVLCRVASERAAEMRAEMLRQAEGHLAEVERSTAAECRRETAECRERIEALKQKKRAEAEAEAAQLASRARERMDEAVNLIVWGIVEKCQ